LTGTVTGLQNGDNLTASYTTTADTNSPVGAYSIVAALIDPDNKLSNYVVTSTNGTLTVTNAATTLSLISSVNPSSQGTGVLFTIQVLALPPATGIPDGSVQLLTNGTAVEASLSLSNGVAELQLSDLPAGTNLVTALYLGTPNFAASSNAMTQIVTGTLDVPATLSILDNHDGTVSISGQGVAGASYILQATDELPAGAWANVSTNTANTNGFWSVTEPGGQNVRFYRSFLPQ
jgi:hypothetical protein